MVEIEFATLLVGLGVTTTARQLLSHSLGSGDLGRWSLAVVILTNTLMWFFGAYLVARVARVVFGW